MLTYKGGNKVGKGTYWDLASGRRIDVVSEGVLAGTATYVRMSSAVMLPVGFFAALAIGAVNLAMKGVASIAGKSMTFEWRPVEAYLAGRKKKEKKDGKK